MTYSIYLTVGEPNSGSEQAARATLAALQKQYDKVGVFRAFTETTIEEDAAFVALANQAEMTDLSDAYGAKSSDYLRSESRAMQILIQRYREFSIGYDAVLILGWLDGDTVRPGLLSLHGRAAANLSAPALLVISSENRDADEVAHMASHELFREHAPVRATIVTSPNPRLPEQIPNWGPHNNLILLDGDELAEDALPVLVKALERGSDVVTPLAFTQSLMSKASSRRKRIVLPESTDERILRAASRVLALSVADVILLGDREEILAQARELHVDVSGATFINKDDSEILDRYAEEFARIRADKGITLEQAREQVADESYFAVMMLHMGDADGMVSGAVHTTADTLRPAFQIVKTKPGVSLVSSSFLLLLEDRVWVAGDCAVNPNPTPEQLADIASGCAETAANFGVDPRVAMLSYSTGSSGKGPDVEAVIEATRIAKEKRPDLLIDGPLQFDAAVEKEVAASKAPDSPVAGKANTFVFPSLEAGNIGYKLVQRAANAIAVGPILQGIAKPVNDLSRGATVEDIVNTIAITAVQAQEF